MSIKVITALKLKLNGGYLSVSCKLSQCANMLAHYKPSNHNQLKMRVTTLSTGAQLVTDKLNNGQCNIYRI